MPYPLPILVSAPVFSWVGIFYLRVGLFYLRLGGGKVWSFLLTVPPRPEIRFGLFLLMGSPVRKLGLVFLAHGFPP